MAHLLSRFLVALILSATAVAAQPEIEKAKPRPFPHEGSDLKPDAAARFGTLENGVRYVVLPNREPRERASLRLLVEAGSLHEAEDQRGLAHFLEHMAFNGSKHYPPGTLIEFFQRMGMSFGGDTNASTTFDRTIYMLELARTDKATLEEGFRVLNDYSDGLLLTEEQIDRERDVILSEKRARDSVGFRTFVARFEAMLGNTRLPQRIPIGTPEVITNAPRERFLDFWNTWYRPERMMVVAVGDFPDPAAVEKMIRTAFGELAARAPSRPDPSLGELTKFEGVRAFFHHEPEAPATNIAITSLTSHTPEPDTAARRLKYLPRALALAMLNRRFSIIAKKEDAPFVSAGASVSEQFDFFQDASVHISSKPEQWKPALAAGEQELRRALEHGFTASELAEAVANRRNQLEQAVKTASTRRSALLADQIVHSVFEEDVFTTPADDLALFQPALDKVTPADCLAALRDDFRATGRFVAVTGNVAVPGDALAAISETYNEAHAAPVAPLDGSELSSWAYSDFGAPGRVVKREHVGDLDVELVTFENGVRLNVKKTDFDADRIVLSARVGNGAITEPAGQRGLAALASSTFIAGGLGKHSADDLRQILAGKNVGWQFTTGADAFLFGGGTTPDDLLLQFQLLAAHLSDPGYRPESLRVARKGMEQLYLSFKHTTNGPLATEVANLLASGDPRFGMPSEEVMLSRNLEEVKSWLTPHLERGAIEVAVAGDLDIEATIAAAAQTIGALPRRGEKPALADLKKLKFPEPPFARDYTIDSAIPKGALLLYWPTDDGIEVQRTRRLNLLAAILNDRLRLKVREEIGGTYSPNAGSNASDTFPGYGYVSANIDVDPATAPKMSELVIFIADDLAQNGVTEDELNRARQPLLTALRESLRQNGYWLNAVLSRAQEKPEVLDWARTRQADIEGITSAEMSALAKQYLGRDRVSRATVLPASKAAQAPPAAAQDEKAL